MENNIAVSGLPASNLTIDEPIPAQVSQPLTNAKPIMGKLVAGALAVGLIVLVLALKCNFFLPSLKIGPTVVKADTSKPVRVNTTSATFTPKPTKADPNPTPVTVSKPIEGKAEYDPSTGKLKITNSGFCFELKAGLSLTEVDGLRPYAGARVFFLKNFGLELMGNDQRAFVGADYRLPVLNLLTLSAGESFGFTDPTLQPYLGLSAQISI